MAYLLTLRPRWGRRSATLGALVWLLLLLPRIGDSPETALMQLVAGWVVPSLGALPAQILLLISSAASLPAMTFACLYAYSIVFKKLFLAIPQMAATHGVVNAFGFALCGLVAWSIINRANAHQP
jgi:hypothetical protein